MTKTRRKPLSEHKNRSLASRLAARARGTARNGLPANWASEALDIYLGGEMSLVEIASIMDVNVTSVRNAIAFEALYRLMAQRNAEKVEDLKADFPIQGS